MDRVIFFGGGQRKRVKGSCGLPELKGIRGLPVGRYLEPHRIVLISDTQRISLGEGAVPSCLSLTTLLFRNSFSRKILTTKWCHLSKLIG